jgi:effector-binding domain-containing protein
MYQDVITTYRVTEKQIPAQEVAAVWMHTSMATIGDDIALGFARVTAAIEISEANLAGPLFLVFHGRIDDLTGGDIELCAPVLAPFNRSADVYGAQIAGGRMASTVHRGPYDDVGPAYAAIMTWMDEHDLRPAGPPREYYLNDAETTKQEDLLTEITFPIR